VPKAVINRWLKQYHHIRPRQALKRKPPATTLTMRLLPKLRAINAGGKSKRQILRKEDPNPSYAAQKGSFLAVCSIIDPRSGHVSRVASCDSDKT
jgi:hypothetical protein